MRVPVPMCTVCTAATRTMAMAMPMPSVRNVTTLLSPHFPLPVSPVASVSPVVVVEASGAAAVTDLNGDLCDT